MKLRNACEKQSFSVNKSKRLRMEGAGRKGQTNKGQGSTDPLEPDMSDFVQCELKDDNNSNSELGNNVQDFENESDAFNEQLDNLDDSSYNIDGNSMDSLNNPKGKIIDLML